MRDIISELQREHEEIGGILKAVRIEGIGSDEGRKSFLEVRPLLINHFRKVVEKMRPVMADMDASEGVKALCEAFIKDSRDLLSLAREVYIKHPNGVSDIESLSDIVTFFNRLGENLLQGKRVLFGQFLRSEGRVTDDDIIQARMYQKEHNVGIENMVVQKGLMSLKDVGRVMVIMEESGAGFGDIAVRKGYMTTDQLYALLKEVSDSHVYIGEALVRLGILNESELQRSLDAYRELTARLNGKLPDQLGLSL